MITRVFPFWKNPGCKLWKDLWRARIFIYSFIPTDIYIDGERGIRRHHPFKLGKRKRESKGNLSIIGGERRHPHSWKSFDGSNSLLFAVECVFHTFLYCLFILLMGFLRQEYWNGLPFPFPVDHVLSELSTHPSWVALHSMAHSFLELHKAVIHVMILISFCDCGFHSGGCRIIVLAFSVCHKGGVICISEIVDISPGSLDSSLFFIQPGISHDVLCI